MVGKEKSFAIGSDHAGYNLKEFIVKHLTLKGYKVCDYGTHSEESVDYTDIIHTVARDIHEGKSASGIIICGSGNGASMTANKYAGVRAALCWIPEIASLARAHNDANILAIPARFVDKELALEMVKSFINTNFEGGRHERRVKKIPIPQKK